MLFIGETLAALLRRKAHQLMSRLLAPGVRAGGERRTSLLVPSARQRAAQRSRAAQPSPGTRAQTGRPSRGRSRGQGSDVHGMKSVALAAGPACVVGRSL